MSDRQPSGAESLADEIAESAADFVDSVTAVAAGEGSGGVIPLLLLQVSQILLAGAQLGAYQDIIPPGNVEPPLSPDPDLDALRTGLAVRLGDFDEYAELFDPYKDTAGIPFRLSDDISAVTDDLIHGLKHYRVGRGVEALWWWQYSYFNHWGTHAGAALRALHAVVAHSSLDVADEDLPPAAGETSS